MAGAPKVWSKFSVRTKDGTVLKLRIIDMPKNLKDTVIDLYINYFVREEKTFRGAGVPKNEKAIEEVQKFLVGAIEAGIYYFVICCLDNGDDQIKDILGASVLTLVSKSDAVPQYDIKTNEIKKIFEILHGLETYYDEIKEFDLDPCFSDKGVFVCPEYRGLGIAQELLRVRRLICKDHGIPIHGAWMTSYGTQKAGERDGWETVCEISYGELAEKFGVDFGGGPPTTKFMIARIE